MIFYLANGTTLAATQADARQLDRNFVQHDIPTDKPGLMAYVQGLLDQIHGDEPLPDYGQDMSSGHNGTPIVAPEVTAEEVEAEFPGYARDEAVALREQIDAAWPGLPLTYRLDLAAMTLEDARKAFRP